MHVALWAVVATSFSFPSLARAQEAAQLFEAPIIVVPDPQQRMNALLDLNDDGWTDAVGTWWIQDDLVGVFGFLNDGAGRLMPLFEDTWTQFGDTGFNFPIAAADLNGDGRDDFVACVRNDLRVYGSNGAGPPTVLSSLSTGSGNEVQDLILADYDNDGAIEAAVRMATHTGNDSGIRIYERLTGNPTPQAFLQPPFQTGFILKNAEVNGDGVMDFFCIGQRIDLFTLNGANIVSAGSYDLNLGNEVNGSAGDVDGDGDEDIVVFAAGGSYRVLRRVGPADFFLEPVASGGPATELADIDGDGDLDGICCGGSGGTDIFINYVQSLFEISINDGTGSFADSFQIPSFGANEIAGADDIDQDGDVDLIAGRVVFYNVDGLRSMVPSVISEQAYDLDLYDVDGDGDMDIHQSIASFDRNLGNGTLETVSRIVPTLPGSFTLEETGVHGDFDGDGDVDVIMTELHGGVPMRQRMLLNTGGGGLIDGGAATSIGTLFPTNFFQPLCGDFNGDQRLDLIIPSFSGTRSDQFLQQPNGTFAAANAFVGEYSARVVDLDADGYDDLIMVDADNWQIRYGDATGAMTTVLRYAQMKGQLSVLHDVAVGDLDGDGDLDLVGPLKIVVSIHTINGVRVLENTGTRQFSVHDDRFPGYEGSLGPVYIGDFNVDGEADVMLGQTWLGERHSKGVGLYLGSATPGLDFTLAGGETYPLFWNMADFDGDGDLDGSSGLGVYRNASIQEDVGGSCLQYGAATPGSGGQEPVLGAVGPFAAGQSIRMRVSGAAPDAFGILFLGTSDMPLSLPAYGGSLQVLPILQSLFFFASSPTADWGSGSFQLTFTAPPGFGGTSFYHQAVIVDVAAQGGASLTNAVRITYAP
jgi:hypothetical protein